MNSLILKQKFLLNLFAQPFTDRSLIPSFGSPEHRDVARQVVRESMVLLQAKNNILPLEKNNQTILVAGTLATDLGAQCGGWTISWQGSNGNITPGTDILTGIKNRAASSKVVYAPNGDYNGSVDVAVVVIGEKKPYAEGAGDRTSLNLEASDVKLVKKLKEAGIPTVAILISGRPLIFGEMLSYADATIAAWYPGTEGEGIAEVLFGEYLPSGQLTHSWPREMAQVPINVEDSDYAPLFPYKHGMKVFPTSTTFDQLLPQAAVTSQDGKMILLSLSDQVTTMDAVIGDFAITIDGRQQANSISGISLAGFDKSILVLTLNNAIEPEAEITLSYIGTGIASLDLRLDSLDHYYVYNSVNSSAKTYAIPGRVEAENYFEMNGIQTEQCSDIGGGLNVGYIENGDWMKYQVEVTQSGVYNLVSRIAGFNGGTLLITFNEAIKTEVNYTATNGWQLWADFNSSVYLPAGRYTMQVHAQSNGFNINYIDFELMIANADNSLSQIQDINVYPNPVEDVFFLELTNTYSREVAIRLMDPAGKEVRLLHQGALQRGVNSYSFAIDAALPKGVYFIEIKDDTQRYFKKIIKK